MRSTVAVDQGKSAGEEEAMTHGPFGDEMSPEEEVQWKAVEEKNRRKEAERLAEEERRRRDDQKLDEKLSAEDGD